MSTLKFVQIAVGNTGHEGSTDPVLYGLTESGEVYQYSCGADSLPNGQKRKDKWPDGREYETPWGPTYFWWQPLRMSAEKGAEPEEPATPKDFLPALPEERVQAN